MLCVKGIDLAYKYFEKEGKKMIVYCNAYKIMLIFIFKGISYKRCGKLIVATNDKEIPRLQDLYERAKINKVPGVELIEGKTIKEIEPYCKV